MDGVRRAKEFIAAGDAYQIVISRRLDTELRADPFTVYRALRQPVFHPDPPDLHSGLRLIPVQAHPDERVAA